MVVKQGEKICKNFINFFIYYPFNFYLYSIVTIQDDMDNANFNIENSVKEMKSSNNINKNNGGMINYALYIVFFIVIILIFLSWIMP